MWWTVTQGFISGLLSSTDLSFQDLKVFITSFAVLDVGRRRPPIPSFLRLYELSYGFSFFFFLSFFCIWWAASLFFLILSFVSFTWICLDGNLLEFVLLESAELLGCVVNVFYQVWDAFGPWFKILLAPSLSSLSATPLVLLMVGLVVSLRLSPFSFILFSVWSSDWIISSNLISSCL